MNTPALGTALVVRSLCLTAALIPALRRWAGSVGLVDDPSGGTHKTHDRATPYGGGVAIYAGSLFALALALYVLSAMATPGGETASPGSGTSPLGTQLAQVAALFAGATVVFAVGLVDDWLGVPFLLRLAVQVASATSLVLLIPGFRLPLSGAPDPLIVVVTVLWIAALTNAFNFLDNMNGLTAGLASICVAAAAVLAAGAGHAPALALSLALVGAALGFLLFNFPRASVFMGDAGSLFLGFVCSGLTVLLSGLAAAPQAGPLNLPHCLAPLLVLAVPAYDLVTVVALRLSRGVAPWHGDSSHISHRLVRLGLSRRDAVLALWGATLGPCMCALALPHLPTRPAWILVIALASGAVGVAFVEYLAHHRRAA